jgi:hypothetical protein
MWIVGSCQLEVTSDAIAVPDLESRKFVTFTMDAPIYQRRMQSYSPNNQV